MSEVTCSRAEQGPTRADAAEARGRIRSRSGGASEAGVEMIGLRAAYGPKTVLAGVDVTVARGSVFALLGPNGAGKTTTVRILATLQPPDGGTARVAGRDVVGEPEAVRQAISLTGQFAAVDDQLTADARRRVKTFSGGMRRKVDLAMSLVGRPDVLFLDEPTTGLDPRSRQAVWDVVGELVGSGVTIFLTTQYLEEADQLADRISVLDGGRLVATGSADDLKRRIGTEQVELALADQAGIERARGLLGPGVVVAAAGRGGAGVVAAAGAEPVVRVPTDGSADHLRYVLDTLAAGGVAVSTASVRRPTLDDVFLTLTATRELEGASR